MKDLRKTIINVLSEDLNKNSKYIDIILDKINQYGKFSLTLDERRYLKQHNENDINPKLEEWLFSDDESTFDDYGNKLLFDEFEEDENIFNNSDKLKRIISKHLKKKPFSNNADWGGGYVWNIKSNNNFVGTFIYFGDDELVVLKRELDDDDEYNDEIIQQINDTKGLYSFLMKVIENI